MKHLSKITLLSIILMALCACSQSGWEPLFNGENFDGWRIECAPQDKDKVFWTIDEGSLLCDSMGNGKHEYYWLLSEEEYGDFELRLKVQTYSDSPGNSGVQIRSRYDREAAWLDGPQVDIHPPDPWRSGLIYDETRGVRHWICPVLPGSKIDESQAIAGWNWEHADEGDGWNDIRIVCKGTAIQTYVNGLRIADFDGAGVLDDEIHSKYKVGMKGHIALQLHRNNELRIRYKDIRLKKLTP